jgi:rod shape-determining protein MreC
LLNLRRIRTFWIWVVLLFAALFLVSSNISKRRSWNPVEQVVIEMTAPIQMLTEKTIDAVEGFWLKYFSLVDLHNENASLRNEIDVLRMQNDRYRELTTVNQRLQQLLQFKAAVQWPAMAAQVIGHDPTGWFESIIIDKGKNNGLKPGMPVVNAQGVVGQLVSVSPNYSKVLLIIDQNSAVDCLIQRSREKGIVKGLTRKTCKMHYVVKTGDVAGGDLVVTSGMGGVYPKGLPVGQVIEVSEDPWEMFKGVMVRPLVDFEKLEEVLVLLREDPLSSQAKSEESPLRFSYA